MNRSHQLSAVLPVAVVDQQISLMSGTSGFCLSCWIATATLRGSALSRTRGNMGMTNRLLIVDDEPGITRLIEYAAHALGIEVLAIHDSDQFEKALEKIRPTIIFLDIAMPRRDGMELIGHLAAGGFSGKVVVMSGSDPRYIQMSSTIATVRGLNVAGTLAKPFRIQAVTDLLTELVEKTPR